MLDAFIIEEIKRRERRKQEQERPQIELPLPEPRNTPRREGDQGPAQPARVVVLDL